MSGRLRRLLGRPGAPGPMHVMLPVGLGEALREGPAPLAGAGPAPERLHVAIVIPQFREGSGGHGTIANIVRGLERRGHRCTLHVVDDEGLLSGRAAAQVDASFNAWFGPVAAPVQLGVGGWEGADVALATGWQTVPAVLRLPGNRARAYLVQDHEPDFYGVSAEREWAAWTYRQGLHHIAASGWLADLLRERYGASASAFQLGVDHELYRPPVTGAAVRRADHVVFYARAVTPRRAVPLGLLALDELLRRRPGLDVTLFGQSRSLALPFAARQAGVMGHRALSTLYGSATLGLVLSMTNPSLVPLEMLACGLPVVDLASDSMRAEFGDDGPVTLAPADPLGLADAIEALLDDPSTRADDAARGTVFVAPRTWDAAAAEVDAGLRAALSLAGAGGAPT